ncbi:MAG: hypothetical protein V4850_16320 [Myxococcota bacterium]
MLEDTEGSATASGDEQTAMWCLFAALLAVEARVAQLDGSRASARERGGDPEDPDEEEGRDPWYALLPA